MNNDHGEAAGVLEGKRLQNDAVENAEDGGGRGDAQSQGQNGKGGEAQVLCQAAQPKSKVLP